ncbi:MULTISPECIES: YqiA/YcfP family alpha/beta fold hydrolase [Halomonadaceae]|uniref:YqiA/YcfP family alpha/beta fold hydrolase n=1 Tax=Halomonadaceae TaxID=28256 RepID=UPI00159A8BB2|nr:MULTISPECIES: YqiA/YcfP family alpha/beta fold hydrolase [Halomonas]QJQ95248.1 esterase [Halomonas sp. PA5]
MLGSRGEAVPVTGVLYLHGFNSGSASPKARLMKLACRRLALPCLAPQLPHRPREAHALAEGCLTRLGPSPLLVGSSMGGFLVSCLAERHDLPAVAINPAVRPARLVEAWLGQGFVNAYTGERFSVEAAHRDELEDLTPARLDPSRYLLLLGTADETLDCRDAFHAYRGARMILHPAGDHGFTALGDYLPAILAHGGHCLAPEAVPANLDGT